MPGPLEGLRAVEMVGLGPGPFCGMLLADLGAEVLRVDRVEAARAVDHRRRRPTRWTGASAPSAVDLKQPDGVDALLRLVEQADALLRGVPARRRRSGSASGPTCASPATRGSSTGG